jgi:hypothetical protein
MTSQMTSQLGRDCIWADGCPILAHFLRKGGIPRKCQARLLHLLFNGVALLGVAIDGIYCDCGLLADGERIVRARQLPGRE